MKPSSLADSPVPGAWQVFQRGRCLRTWRSTESARRIQRELYLEEFRMPQADNAVEAPTVAPLRAA